MFSSLRSPTPCRGELRARAVPGRLFTERASSAFSQKRWRGAAAVEFALILPLLLLLVGGMVEMSWIMFDQAVLTNASREGARAGIVLRNPKLTDEEIEAVVTGYTAGALLGLGPQTVPTVTVEQDTDPQFSSPLRVSVSYPFTGFAAVGLMSLLSGPVQLGATTVMRHE